MKRVLPVAVKFLHKGNKILSRNMASYLSLAAIDNSPLLSNHIQLIIDSIISGYFKIILLIYFYLSLNNVIIIFNIRKLSIVSSSSSDL